MRFTMIECDWKEDLQAEEILGAIELVGGGPGAFVRELPQNDVDAKVTFFCSERLTRAQMDLLWEAGDLWLEDRVFEAPDFDGLVAAVRTHRRVAEGGAL